MTGSDPNLIAIVVPIVALVSLAFWLGLCFWAGSHPFWRHHQQAAQQLASPDQAGQLPPSATQGLSSTAGGTSDGAPGVQRVARG
jgi:hypothetical protein